jgi:SOS-response transcriptional repressor LexA
MPSAKVIRIDERRGARRDGQYVRLQLALPGQPEHDIGLLLVDAEPGSPRFALRLRRHWEDLADAEDIEYLSAVEEDFQDKIADLGVHAFLESLEDSLSHILRLTERETVAVDSFSRVADQLFERYVEPLHVDRFRTHLPLFTLRAAAGKFGADEEVEEEDWVRAPEGTRLTTGMFVAHVMGHSMEPLIPDGSLNIFRAPVVGSRAGKIVLVSMRGVLDHGSPFTVKKYTSTKIRRPAGEDEEGWEHSGIRLEPLNPDYEPLDLEPDQIESVVAEWIQTLE